MAIEPTVHIRVVTLGRIALTLAPIVTVWHEVRDVVSEIVRVLKVRVHVVVGLLLTHDCGRGGEKGGSTLSPELGRKPQTARFPLAHRQARRPAYLQVSGLIESDAAFSSYHEGDKLPSAVRESSFTANHVRISNEAHRCSSS